MNNRTGGQLRISNLGVSRVRRLLSIGIILVLAACFCFSSHAEDGGDVILAMSIDAAVESDGDMQVVQTARYQFETEGNGFYIDFDFELDGAVTVEESSSGDWVEYTQRSSASNGERGVFTLEGNRLKIYYPTSGGEEAAFRICYGICNAAQRYADTAELYWQVIPAGYDFPIYSLDISLETPAEGASMEANRVWGHSPAEGMANIVDDNHFSFFLTDVYAHEMVEIRALFSSDSLPDAAMQPGQRLSAVLEEEEAYIRADQRDNAFRILSWIAGIAALAASAALLVALYFKYDKEYPLAQKYDYYRELPEPYPPAEAAVLIRYKKLTPDDITATIMDLARREYLIIEEAADYVSRYGLQRRCSKGELVITATDKPREGLAGHERYLLDWLLGDCGNGVALFMDDLHTLSKSSSSAQRFLEHYQSWQSQVQAATAGRDYFDDGVKGLRLAAILIGVGLLAIGVLSLLVNANGRVEWVGGKPLFLLAALPLIVYPMCIRRRSRYGGQKYHEWMAFRRYLVDFSNMKEASQQSLAIWEHYLVYAVTLGVAKTVIRQLKVNIPALSDPSQITAGDILMTHMLVRHFGMSEAISYAVGDSISHALTASRSTVSANSSGSGGGFSGGGGGGFGGGGGSGRF